MQTTFAGQCTILTKNVQPEDIVTILTIDGGGVRGIIPARMLSYIENQAGIPISDMFDFVMGTSTGSIIAAGLTLSNKEGEQLYSATEVEERYVKQAPKLFSASFLHRLKTGFGLFGPRYDGVSKTKMLKENFKDFKLNKLRTHVMIPAYSITTRKPIYFDNTLAKKSPKDNYYLANLINGTTAAPTYYPAVGIKSLATSDSRSIIDGAIFMNNPTLEAYIQASKLYKNKVFIILSLGTGLHSIDLNPNQAKHWGLLHWANNIVGIIFSASNQAVNEQMQVLAQNPHNSIAVYERYDRAISPEHINIDDASPSNLKVLQDIADDMIAANSSELNSLIACLKYSHSMKKSGKKAVPDN